MGPDFLIALLAALVPMVIGFIYYHPKVMGTAWMNICGLTKEKMEGANMPLVLGLSYFFSFMLAFILYSLVVHQTHIFSTLLNEEGFGVEGSEIQNYLNDFMASYGDRFRTFGHGALHGTILGVFFAFPIFATNSLFERKPFKYTLINIGYWIITLALMGGILCQWG